MSDLIDRQAAIGRAVEIPLFGKPVKLVAVSELEALPSAQPEKRTQERTETHACDCISRQAAIDALSHMMDTDGFRGGWTVSRANVDCMLRSLPSAQPEKADCATCKHGRFGSVQCNRCSVGFPNNYEKDERYG